MTVQVRSVAPIWVPFSMTGCNPVASYINGVGSAWGSNPWEPTNNGVCAWVRRHPLHGSIDRFDSDILHQSRLGMEYFTDGRRHLVCKPYSIPNLHRMAEELDIKRCWFHRDHYDIPKRRITEIESKCTLVRPRDIVKIIKGV